MKKHFLLLALLWCQIAFPQNPITGYTGVSDPHIKVFNDTIYLYSGHDNDPRDRKFVMKDWRVFSTTDLVNWTLRTTIRPEDNYMGTSTDCWATDAATRNGKYYFYFSDEARGIGVMVSNSPTGPFKDALGKPLLQPWHDPTAFIDDDKAKTPYIVYGCKEAGGYSVVRLNNDMISLAEKPKLITLNGDDWKYAPGFMDKNYLFKYKNIYYLSWGTSYAKSTNIYGPYECAGNVGSGFNLNPLAHSSLFWWKGQFYHVWCRNVKLPFKFRESIISYCHFADNGDVVTDTKFLEQHYANGVGQYNASWSKIEAEWYYEIAGNIQKKGNEKDGFILSNIKNGNWVRFANVTFDKPFMKFCARVSQQAQVGYLEIRTDSSKGNLLGKVKLNSNTSFQEAFCLLKGFTGKRDVYLVYKGTKASEMQLDWFKFQEQ